MSSKRLPPVAAVIGFIDCINRGDIDGLGKLMTDDHELVVFDEDAVQDGQLCCWRLLEDTPGRRAELGLTSPARSGAGAAKMSADNEGMRYGDRQSGSGGWAAAGGLGPSC